MNKEISFPLALKCHDVSPEARDGEFDSHSAFEFDDFDSVRARVGAYSTFRLEIPAKYLQSRGVHQGFIEEGLITVADA